MNDNKLRIGVSDTAVGLTKEFLSQLFKSFERFNIRDNVEGTGIGLTITKQLVELMNVNVTVVSIPGEDSTFWLELEISTQK